MHLPSFSCPRTSVIHESFSASRYSANATTTSSSTFHLAPPAAKRSFTSSNPINRPPKAATRTKACPFLAPEQRARIHFLNPHAGPGESDNSDDDPVALVAAPVAVVEGARRRSAFVWTAFRNANSKEDTLEGVHADEAMAEAASVVGRGNGRILR
jgi:hypothetical protein